MSTAPTPSTPPAPVAGTSAPAPDLQAELLNHAHGRTPATPSTSDPRKPWS